MSRIKRDRSIRRKLVVGDQDRVAGLRFSGYELVHLALADIEVGVDMAAVLPFGAYDFGAGGVSQVREFRDRFLGRPAGVFAAVDGHEERPLCGSGQIDHVFRHTGAG